MTGTPAASSLLPGQPSHNVDLATGFLTWEHQQPDNWATAPRSRTSSTTPTTSSMKSSVRLLNTAPDWAPHITSSGMMPTRSRTCRGGQLGYGHTSADWPRRTTITKTNVHFTCTDRRSQSQQRANANQLVACLMVHEVPQLLMMMVTQELLCCQRQGLCSKPWRVRQTRCTEEDCPGIM